LNQKEIQYLNLQRDSDSNQQLYEAVLKRLKETGVTGGLETNNVSVIEDASVPRTPVRPRKTINLPISVLVGLVVGVAAALVIASCPGEGKSTTVANFGVVLAQTGSRVCLIDSDLRRPTLHRVFGLGNNRGLTSALLEGLPCAEVAQTTPVPGLSVLTSGPVP